MPQVRVMPSRKVKPSLSGATIADPRSRRGFRAELFPLCDGADPPPPGPTDKVARRQIEFLAAYYQLNRLYAKLAAVRRGRGNAEPVLKEIAEALRARDSLEDRYAPEGFLGEPEMDGLFIRNVTFSHARAALPAPASGSSFSLFVPLVLPKGLTLRKYLERELGLRGGRARSPGKQSRGRR
jgi:hypothetical protein